MSKRPHYKLCLHCDKELSIKRFKEHEKLFFKQDSNEWIKACDIEAQRSENEMSDFSDFSEAAGEFDMIDSGNLESDRESGSWEIEDSEMEDNPNSPQDQQHQQEQGSKSGESESECEYWLEIDEEIDGDVLDVSSVPPHDQELRLNNEGSQEKHIIIKWIVCLVSFFQSRFVISDHAISWLLRFLRAIFLLFGRFSKEISSIGEAIPPSIYKLKNSIFRSQHGSFIKYNVCKKCNSLYSHEECLQLKHCPYKPFPRSQYCGALLLKQIVSAGGQKKLYPHKIFCTSPLSSSLQNLVLQQGFIEHCESTRSLFSCTGLSDVYDGDIWRCFQEIDGNPFLSSPNNYGLLLNIDWYQPFEHLTYSVGVIYLVILNLPRSLRFKRENVLLYGLIPGPSEPSLTVNSFLSPMVSDLLELSDSISKSISVSSTFKKYSYVTRNGKHINSMLKPSAKDAYALAVPVIKFSSSPPEVDKDLRPVKLHYFMEHSLCLPGMDKPKTHILANVSWPMVHPQRSKLGKPVEVWCNELYEPNSKNTFIPVSSIASRVIYSIDQICDENVLIIIPLIE